MAGGGRRVIASWGLKCTCGCPLNLFTILEGCGRVYSTPGVGEIAYCIPSFIFQVFLQGEEHNPEKGGRGCHDTLLSFP